MRKPGDFPHFKKQLAEFIAQVRGISFADAVKVCREKSYTEKEYSMFMAKAMEVTKEEQLSAGINLIRQKSGEDKAGAVAPSCGMPKISAQLLSNIGKASPGRTEIAVIIELARCQDQYAEVVVSNRLLAKRTGYSKVMTMLAMKNLSEYGLITMEKIGGWRYRIRINGNGFDKRYRFRQGYIPANMRIFSEDAFRKATASERFLILQMLFMLDLKQYRDEMKSNPNAGNGDVTVYVPFEKLRHDFNRTSYYSNYAFTKTVARLKKDFGAKKLGYWDYMKIKKETDPFCGEGGHMLAVTFRKGMFATDGGSDNFIRKKHIIELVAEKQGIGFSEKELAEAAKVFPRTDGGMEDIFSMGKEYLKKVKSAEYEKRIRPTYSEWMDTYDLELEEAQSFLVKIGDMVSRKNGINTVTGNLRKRRLTDNLLTTGRFLCPEERITCAVIVGELFKSRFLALKKNVIMPFASAVNNAVQTLFRLYDPQGKLWRDRVPAT